MDSKRHFIKNSLSAIIGVILFVLSASLAWGWTEPSSSPPAGNVTAPVNVGATTQSKSGAFSVLGNFGVGTASPASQNGVTPVLDISGSNAELSLRTSTNGGYVGTAWYGKTAGAVVQQYYAGLGVLLSNGAWELYDKTQNADRITVLTNGNVGIGTGTVAPIDTFEVAAAGANHIGVQVGTLDATAIKLNAYNAAGVANIPMEFRATKYIYDLGNVGIGTASPTANLYVLGSGTQYTVTGSDAPNAAAIEGTNASQNQGTLDLWTSDAVAQNAGGSIGFGGRYNTGVNAIWAKILGGKYSAAANEYGGYMAFLTRTDGANNVERMRIDTNGNVGIGTTGPGSTLQVAGAISTPIVTFANGATTPSVSGSNVFLTANTGATTITNFTNGVPGQIITIICGDTNTTINRANAYLLGSGNFTCGTIQSTITLIHGAIYWNEVTRSNTNG